MSPLHLVLSSLLLFALDPIQAIQYKVLFDNATGTPGGIRFENEIGQSYSEEILQLASEFIWETFQQGESDRKRIDEVTMVVENMDGIAYTNYNDIHLSTEYVANYLGDVRIEVIGILYHETTHIWQWYGNDKAPTGLTEGIADFIRLKAGLVPSHWAGRRAGKSWDEGYVTSFFLDYCNCLKDGFVASLNRLMKDSYSNEFFVKLLGETMNELWEDYKSKYGS